MVKSVIVFHKRILILTSFLSMTSWKENVSQTLTSKSHLHFSLVKLEITSIHHKYRPTYHNKTRSMSQTSQQKLKSLCSLGNGVIRNPTLETEIEITFAPGRVHTAQLPVSLTLDTFDEFAGHNRMWIVHVFACIYQEKHARTISPCSCQLRSRIQGVP